MRKLNENLFETSMRENAFFLANVDILQTGYVDEFGKIIKLNNPNLQYSDDIIIKEYGLKTDLSVNADISPYSNGFSFTEYVDDLTLQERKLQSGGITPPNEGYFLDRQQIKIGVRESFIDKICKMQIGQYYFGGISIDGINPKTVTTEKPIAGHENIYIIYRTDTYRYVFKRFEPNYSEQRNPVGIYSLMNIYPDDHVTLCIMSKLQTELNRCLGQPVTIDYQSLDPGCPNLGFQREESSSGTYRPKREERGGYCLYWSLVVVHTMLLLINRGFTGGDILSEAIKVVDNEIKSVGGDLVNYRDKAKLYIRIWASKINYEILKWAAEQQKSISMNEGWKLIRFIRNTIPYSHVSEVLMRKMIYESSQCQSGSVTISPIQINMYRWPAGEFRNEVIAKELIGLGTNQIYGLFDIGNEKYDFFTYTGTYVYKMSIDVDTITNPARLRVGILTMKDNTVEGPHVQQEIEHVNTVILRYEDNNKFTLSRFEPQYNRDEPVTEEEKEDWSNSMINIGETSVWTQMIGRVIKGCYEQIFPERKFVFEGQPIIYDNCPNIGKYGPQFIESLQPRGETEHLGYCQTWSFAFLEAYLTELCSNPGSVPDTTRIVNQFLVGSNISQTVQLTAEQRIPSEVSKALYDFIRGKASYYCKIIFDEVYVPYFIYKGRGQDDPFYTQWENRWKKNLEDFR